MRQSVPNDRMQARVTDENHETRMGRGVAFHVCVDFFDQVLVDHDHLYDIQPVVTL